MLGAIIGDIVGSRFEWHNIKSKEFTFFHIDCFPTDDSIMTLAIAKAILACDGDYSNLGNQAVICMQELGRRYPDAGYGGHFRRWLKKQSPEPYNSLGNGSAMRVSPVAYIAENVDHLKALSRAVTEVTHNHPSGIKGAEATAVAIFMALHGASKQDIKKVIDQEYYNLDFYQLDEIRADYSFDVTCDGTVPYAIEAFMEATSFEDTIRNAISIGGDSDTLAAIAGSIAEAYYGIPENIRNQAVQYMDKVQIEILDRFEEKYGVIREKEIEKDIL